MIILIACVGKNYELGKDGDLVFHYKKDLAFFQRKTVEHMVVMGRKTWESLPKRLKHRCNCVVSRSVVLGADICVSDLEDFLKTYKDDREEVFVIGGASIYEQALPYASKIYLTEIPLETEADVFFPKFNKADFAESLVDELEENGVQYKIKCYTRNVKELAS